MRLTTESVLKIQKNETRIFSYLNFETRKYGFVVCYGKSRRYLPITALEPKYDSAEIAMTAGKDFVTAIREMGADPNKKSLTDFVDGEEEIESIEGKVN